MSKGVVGSILVVAAVAALMVASGCGGGDSSSSLTKAQYVKQVNKICQKEEQKRFGELMTKGQKLEEEARGKEISAKAKEEAFVSVVPAFEKMVSDLRELEAPEGEEDKVEAIYDAMDEAAQKVRANPGTALVSDLPFKEAEKLAKDYGLTACNF